MATYDSQCCSDVSEEDGGTGLNYSNTERETFSVSERERGGWWGKRGGVGTLQVADKVSVSLPHGDTAG